MSEQKQPEVLTTPTNAPTKIENVAPKTSKKNLSEKKQRQEEKKDEKMLLKKLPKRRMAVVLSSDTDIEEAKPIKRNKYGFNVISTAEVVGMPEAVVGKFGYTDMHDKAWDQFRSMDDSEDSKKLEDTESEGSGTTLEESGEIYDADDFLEKVQLQHDNVFSQVQSIIEAENKMNKKNKTNFDPREVENDKKKVKAFAQRKLELIKSIYAQSYEDIKFFLT